ncbi:Fat storage-inducing transmembrane protein 1 [Dissostichus eleginoides]|uniref:Fat storage-inducing transmembrane protein 1 n=1 Tax=Dissostichus eleginoides TaxID=100907 RepID=A0AAD9B9I0_DISEL|nr:Fat storage-inducing transmembrane protein 1 [Dissostichus eleginoides]
MFFNTVLVVLTDLAARFLGSAIFRKHFHLVLSVLVMFGPALSLWVSQHSVFAKKTHFLYRIFLRSGWGWTCIFVGSFVFLLSFSIRRSISLSIRHLLGSGWQADCGSVSANSWTFWRTPPEAATNVYSTARRSPTGSLCWCCKRGRFPTQLLGGALGCLSWRGLYQSWYRLGPSWYCPGRPGQGLLNTKTNGAAAEDKLNHDQCN